MAPPSGPTAAEKKQQIASALERLHADEIPDLAKGTPHLVRGDDDYWGFAWNTVVNYLRYLRATWSRALWGTMFLPTNIFDRLSIYAFAFFSSVILGFLLIWCLIYNHPALKRRYEVWSKQNAHGYSMTNASYPYLFDELVDEEMKAAREVLAAKVKLHPTTVRVFNLDVAKLLLQCSAIMYERSTNPLQTALDITRETTRERDELDRLNNQQHKLTLPDIKSPGDLLQSTLGQRTQEVRNKLHAEEHHMAAFAKHIGFEYATMSELNSQSSAVCGIFYDPNSTYMILAFRGTSPAEWSEWAADFSYEPRHAGHTIRGFGKVHGGFFDRIFPRKITPGARMPYDTIKEGIKRTATILLKGREPDTPINIWFTGHSLGTALATLVYATAVSEPNAFGANVIIRDAYLFATPIISDVQSVHSFHNRMGRDKVRTMWRITNGKDIVATGLPHSGDHQSWSMSPYNLFSFAHLGMEIKLRSYPERCEVTGNQFAHGSHVRIQSYKYPPKSAGLRSDRSNGQGTPIAVNGSGTSTPFMNGTGTSSPLINGNEVFTPLPIDGTDSPHPFDAPLSPSTSMSPNLNGLANRLKLNGARAGLFLKTEFGTEANYKDMPSDDEEQCTSPTFEDLQLQLPLLPPHIEDHLDMPTPEERERLRRRLRKWQKIPLVGRLIAHSTAAYWDQLQNVRVGGCEWMDE